MKRRFIQHWNQPEELLSQEKQQIEVGEGITVTVHSFTPYGGYWNPHIGNVRVGKREVKWYNLFK